MFVSANKVAVAQLPDGTIVVQEDDGLPTGPWRAFRAGLGDDAREGLNVIFIVAKMGVTKKKVVMDELTRITATPPDGTIGAGAPAGQNVAISVGAYQIALLYHNILSWQGPAFAEVPITRANLDRLDPDEPLLNAVLAEIGRRNPLKQASPDPKSPAATSGSTSAGAPALTDASAPPNPSAAPTTSTSS